MKNFDIDYEDFRNLVRIYRKKIDFANNKEAIGLVYDYITEQDGDYNTDDLFYGIKIVDTKKQAGDLYPDGFDDYYVKKLSDGRYLCLDIEY
jgi:hypothetical protein